MSSSRGIGLSAARRPAAGIIDRLGGAFATVWLWGFRTRTRRRLALLDDHLLRDIGISEATRADEIAKPFWRG